MGKILLVASVGLIFCGCGERTVETKVGGVEEFRVRLERANVVSLVNGIGDISEAVNGDPATSYGGVFEVIEKLEVLDQGNFPEDLRKALEGLEESLRRKGEVIQSSPIPYEVMVGGMEGLQEWIGKQGGENGEHMEKYVSAMEEWDEKMKAVEEAEKVTMKPFQEVLERYGIRLSL